MITAANKSGHRVLLSRKTVLRFEIAGVIYLVKVKQKKISISQIGKNGMATIKGDCNKVLIT